MEQNLTDRIDDVVAGATADAAGTKQLASDETDIEPNGLEAALRLRLSPEHTNFRHVPTLMVDEQSGEPAAGIVACQAIWAIPDGVWSVVSFPCPNSGDTGLINLKISGPDTADVTRKHKTVSEALGLLVALGALHAE